MSRDSACSFCSTSPSIGEKACSSRDQADGCAWFTPEDMARVDRNEVLKAAINREIKFEHMRTFIDWVDVWASNSIENYSTTAMEGFLSEIRRRVAVMRAND
jgi:hypothetical protein